MDCEVVGHPPAPLHEGQWSKWETNHPYPSPSLCLSVFVSVCLPVCLSLSLCLSLPACLSLSVCLYLSVSVSLSVSFCLSICVSFCLSVCLSVRLSVCLFVCLSVSCVDLTSPCCEQTQNKISTARKTLNYNRCERCLQSCGHRNCSYVVLTQVRRHTQATLRSCGCATERLLHYRHLHRPLLRLNPS